MSCLSASSTVGLGTRRVPVSSLLADHIRTLMSLVSEFFAVTAEDREATVLGMTITLAAFTVETLLGSVTSLVAVTTELRLANTFCMTIVTAAFADHSLAVLLNVALVMAALATNFVTLGNSMTRLLTVVAGGGTTR